MPRKNLTDISRKLRREQTPAEKILWSILRNRAFGGLKFRRQQEVGPHVVDFYCAAIQLVIELDGESHLGKDTQDEERQRWLEFEGILVVRFCNHELYDDSKSVQEVLLRVCEDRMCSLGHDGKTIGPRQRKRR